MDDLGKQVAAQHRVVVHLARALADVHEQTAEMIDAGIAEDLLEMRGERSAYIMEVLGDILSNMDAVDDDEDAWTAPVFEEAQKRWPNIRQRWDDPQEFQLTAQDVDHEDTAP